MNMLGGAERGSLERPARRMRLAGGKSRDTRDHFCVYELILGSRLFKFVFQKILSLLTLRESIHDPGNKHKALRLE